MIPKATWNQFASANQRHKIVLKLIWAQKKKLVHGELVGNVEFWKTRLQISAQRYKYYISPWTEYTTVVPDVPAQIGFRKKIRNGDPVSFRV